MASSEISFQSRLSRIWDYKKIFEKFILLSRKNYIWFQRRYENYDLSYKLVDLHRKINLQCSLWRTLFNKTRVAWLKSTWFKSDFNRRKKSKKINPYVILPSTHTTQLAVFTLITYFALHSILLTGKVFQHFLIYPFQSFIFFRNWLQSTAATEQKRKNVEKKVDLKNVLFWNRHWEKFYNISLRWYAVPSVKQLMSRVFSSRTVHLLVHFF